MCLQRGFPFLLRGVYSYSIDIGQVSNKVYTGSQPLDGGLLLGGGLNNDLLDLLFIAPLLQA